MPTVFTHPAAALALATFLRRRPTVSLLVAGGFCTVLPDLDVIGLYLGIPYGHPAGHRGFSHSLLFAVLVGTFASGLWRYFITRDHQSWVLFVYFSVATASNGLLDALTNGGKGVGFFIPFDSGRYFFPYQPIRVAPISAESFFDRGWPVLVSELRWVWGPALLIVAVGLLISGLQSGDGEDDRTRSPRPR